MNDFLGFIEKDIATKKLTIQTLPIKTKTNIKKLNETIKIYEDKYEEYRTEQIDTTDIIEACYHIGCKVENIVSVTRIYKGND